MASRDRPLSPHLQVYRFGYTMALSILHRMSGIALSFGLLALTAWLTGLAAGARGYGRLVAVLGSAPGLVLLAGVLAAFCYHLCSGVRHLLLDTGHGLERREARVGALITVIAAVLLFLVCVAFFAAHLLVEP
jgi:succinate dehydrogenase / fumarate reductase cytochrome b subunit